MDDLDLYISTVIGWQLHPGYQKPGMKPLTTKECVAMAVQIKKEKDSWLGLQQQQQ